jgi:hypothetical protein
MPPIRTRKVTPEEKRIATAIREIQDRIIKNVAIAARTYSVLYHKLYHCYNGQPAANILGSQNKALSLEQESAVVLYIDWCEELGRPYKYKHIELAANSLLWASGFSGTVSKLWTTRFIKQTNLLCQCSKPLSTEKKASQKCDNIELYFEKFIRWYRELQIKPKNLYNFDKTGFRIGYLAGMIVFT